MHVEDVAVPCFMVRRGPYKYIHVHGVDAQLFDVVEDPGEWRNLVNDPAHQTVLAELRGALLERFDPEAIDADVGASLRRRMLIDRAMQHNGTRWDYAPSFDANEDALRQYVRRSVRESHRGRH